MGERTSRRREITLEARNLYSSSHQLVLSEQTYLQMYTQRSNKVCALKLEVVLVSVHSSCCVASVLCSHYRLWLGKERVFLVRFSHPALNMDTSLQLSSLYQ